MAARILLAVCGNDHQLTDADARALCDYLKRLAEWSTEDSADALWIAEELEAVLNSFGDDQALAARLSYEDQYRETLRRAIFHAHVPETLKRLEDSLSEEPPVS
jgi:hypothetical protein